MKLYYLSLACILLLLCGCAYSPSGYNTEEINPVPENNIEISLSDKQDTVFAKGWVKLKFDLEFPGKNFYAYQLLLDGQVVAQVERPDFSYDLLTSEFPDGAHELKLVLLTSSGTRSLADKLGYETIQEYKTWVLITDNAPPSPIQITNVFEEDGTLRIQWEKYKRRDIKSYRVMRLDPNTGHFKIFYTVSPNQTSLIDTTYLGGPTTFIVTVIDNNNLTADSEKYNFSTETPRLIKYEYINGSDLRLTFQGTKFYKNFGSYTVKNASGMELKYKTTSISDTVVTFKNLPLIPAFELQFYVATKGPYIEPYYTNNGVITYSRIPGNGVQHDLPYDVRLHEFNPELNLLYDFLKQTISVVDAQTMKLKHQRKLNYDAYARGSFSVKYIYAKQLTGELMQLNPHTLEDMKSINLQALLPEAELSTYGFSVSDNNRMVVVTYLYNKSDILYVLDMNTGQLEMKHTIENEDRIYSISPDGKTVFADNKMFRRTSIGNWQELNIDRFPTALPEYHPTEPYYITSNFSTVTVHSTIDNSIINTFTLENSAHASHIDPATGYLLARSDDSYYIYDIINSRKLKEFKVFRISDYSYDFFKDKLISKYQYWPI